MVTRIGRRSRRQHLYIAQWREFRGYSVEALAARVPTAKGLGVDRTTMWRWEVGKRQVTPEQQAAIARALDIEPPDLWRVPDSRPSLDAMMSGTPDDIFDAVADMARRLSRRAS